MGKSIITIISIVILIAIAFSVQNGLIKLSPDVNPNVAEVITNFTKNLTHMILPNHTLTPGDILTNNLSIICVTGYSSTVRDVPQSLRLSVFKRDGVSYPQPTGDTELDHIIPLCLGGSNDAKNLFVEFAEPRPGYKEKDKLENYLCDHVCSGEIDIDIAQERIASDWYRYYQEIYG